MSCYEQYPESRFSDSAPDLEHNVCQKLFGSPNPHEMIMVWAILENMMIRLKRDFPEEAKVWEEKVDKIVKIASPE